MLLITELNEDVEYVTEANAAGEKNLYIKGIFLEGDIKNRNGRRYPINVLDKEASRYIKEMVNTSRAYGELNHPSGPQISLDRVSHLITELVKDGSNYIGKAKIMETPCGAIAKGILNSGGKLGISSRGLGTIKTTNEGIMEVQEDFHLATAGDIVSDPSGPNCFINGIMENYEWVYDEKHGFKALEYVEETKKNIHKNYNKLNEETKFSIFENFLSQIISK